MKLQLAGLGRVNAQVVIQQGLGLGGMGLGFGGDSKSGKALAKALSTTASDENDTKVIEILRTHQRGMDLNLKAATDATGKFRKEAFACFSQAAEQGHVGAICQMVSRHTEGFGPGVVVIGRESERVREQCRGLMERRALQGLFYLNGYNLVKIDVPRARDLFMRASRGGDKEAASRLAYLFALEGMSPPPTPLNHHSRRARV